MPDPLEGGGGMALKLGVGGGQFAEQGLAGARVADGAEGIDGGALDHPVAVVERLDEGGHSLARLGVAEDSGACRAHLGLRVLARQAAELLDIRVRGVSRELAHCVAADRVVVGLDRVERVPTPRERHGDERDENQQTEPPGHRAPPVGERKVRAPNPLDPTRSRSVVQALRRSGV